MRKSKLFVLMLLFGMFSLVHAQERTISGTVTDAETGEGLPGVSVMVQGTSSGTATDFNGAYSLNADNNTVLVFSFIGYESQEVSVGTRSTIDVSLNTDVQTLSEVVVVGYGTQTKQEVTSAVTSIKPEDFNQGNVNDPAQLLQGKVAGMTIVRAGANPNAPFSIRVRGLGSIGPNTQPLIIIDGVPSAGLGQVDPADIAAIDILKDGAAAAIYGTRGANGVIIVTTKTGRSGQTSFEYNGYGSVEKVAKSVPVLEAADFRSNGGTDLGSSTNWFDEITQNSLSQTHNMAMSGGTDKTTYRLSLNYRDQSGIQRMTGFDQLNTRINVQQKLINDKLTLSGVMSMTRRNANYGFEEAFRYAAVFNPTGPVMDPAGDFRNDDYFQTGGFDIYNPVAIIEQNTNEGTDRLLNFHIKGDYEIVDGLNYDIAYSQQTDNQLRGRYYDKQSLWNGAGRNGLANRNTANYFTEIFETTLRYEKDINDMNLRVMGGYSWQENVNEGFSAEGGNFVSDRFAYNNLGAALDFADGLGSVSSGKAAARLISFFGRANLNINDTYFLMASVRRDGSSTFGVDNRWGLFPAVSAGADLSKLIDISGVDNLKLRASYGTAGTLPPVGGNIQSSLGAYNSIARVGPQGNAFVNGKFQPAYGPISNSNSGLKWEKKEEFDVGIDFSLLDFKMNGSIDFYSKTTNDLLLDFPVPVPPNLYPETLLNLGTIKNTGLEASINYLLVDNQDMTFETGLNFSTFSTELVSLSKGDFEFGDRRIITNLGSPGQNGTLMILVKEGEEIGNFWGPKHVDGQPVNEAGDWNLEDTDGDGDVDDDDDTIIGNGLPTFQMGWRNVVNYGNWDFSAFFRGVFGHDLINTYRAFYENPNLISTYNVMASSLDSELDGLVHNANVFGSYHVEKASYLKLDNASLGYSIPLSASSSFTKARLYLAGQNLIMFTNYSGVDPEVRFQDNDGGVLAPGIDRRNTWFRTSSVTFGVQLNVK